MDNLKFRAWDDDFGDFLTINMFELNDDGEIIGIVHEGDFIGYNKEKTHLMQFTGLKDKNCKEIYEGDLLEDEEKQLWQIEFNNGSYIATNVFMPGSRYIDKDLIVVGNIYENPDLLK